MSERGGGSGLPTCFVAMPVSTPEIYIQRYGDSDHFKHVLECLFAPAITAAGYEVIEPSVSGSDVIHAAIIRSLESADLVLCDISSLNPNVFFEFGIRTSLDLPVALVRDEATPKIPFDTMPINTHKYDAAMRPWNSAAEIAQLSEHIKQTVEKSSGKNPLWQYFGLTKRAHEAEITTDPGAAKLDLILAELAQVKQAQSVQAANTYSFNVDPSYTYGTSVGANVLTGNTDWSTYVQSSPPPTPEPIPAYFADFVAASKGIAGRESVTLTVKYDKPNNRIILDSGLSQLSFSAQRAIEAKATSLRVEHQLHGPAYIGTVP